MIRATTKEYSKDLQQKLPPVEVKSEPPAPNEKPLEAIAKARSRLGNITFSSMNRQPTNATLLPRSQSWSGPVNLRQHDPDPNPPPTTAPPNEPGEVPNPNPLPQGTYSVILAPSLDVQVTAMCYCDSMHFVASKHPLSFAQCIRVMPWPDVAALAAVVAIPPFPAWWLASEIALFIKGSALWPYTPPSVMSGAINVNDLISGTFFLTGILWWLGFSSVIIYQAVRRYRFAHYMNAVHPELDRLTLRCAHCVVRATTCQFKSTKPAYWYKVIQWLTAKPLYTTTLTDIVHRSAEWCRSEKMLESEAVAHICAMQVMYSELVRVAAQHLAYVADASITTAGVTKFMRDGVAAGGYREPYPKI